MVKVTQNTQPRSSIQHSRVTVKQTQQGQGQGDDTAMSRRKHDKFKLKQTTQQGQADYTARSYSSRQYSKVKVEQMTQQSQGQAGDTARSRSGRQSKVKVKRKAHQPQPNNSVMANMPRHQFKNRPSERTCTKSEQITELCKMRDGYMEMKKGQYRLRFCRQRVSGTIEWSAK